MGKLIDVNKWFKDTFPKADLDYPTLDNKKAYPHWSIDITGLADILNDAESVEAIPKADVVDMLEVLKANIDIMSDTVVEGRTVTITSWKGMQKRICKLIQSKIDKYKGE